MAAKISDIIKAMESFAPRHLAEEWDNVGLQVGQNDWPVKKVWIALDPAPDVVEAACSKDVDLIIAHHPLIFRPLKSIDFSTPVGYVINMAVRHRTAIFSAHTNLDSAKDGINDVIARRIGLKNLKVLGKFRGAENYKLVFYVPVEYEQKVLDSLFETSAGEIGNYSCCSFRNKGKGTFRPGSQANPFIGKPGETTQTDEIRIEAIVQKSDLKSVIQHVKKDHPYELMAYDIYPLITQENAQGIGRIGELDEEKKLADFALEIKKILKLKSVKIAGKPDLPVKSVSVCTGSGSSLINNFFSSGSQVYISGDLRYHDARAVEAANLGLIDIGHFASEHLIVEVLAERLQEVLVESEFDVKVEACKLEKDPFVILES